MCKSWKYLEQPLKLLLTWIKHFAESISGQLKFSIKMFLNYIHKTTCTLDFEQSPVRYPKFQDFEQNCWNRMEKNNLLSKLLGVPQCFPVFLLRNNILQQINIVMITGVIQFRDPAYYLCLELQLSWGWNHVSVLVVDTTMELSHSRSSVNDTSVKLLPV